MGFVLFENQNLKGNVMMEFPVCPKCNYRTDTTSKIIPILKLVTLTLPNEQSINFELTWKCTGCDHEIKPKENQT